jgi:hypothetical protein
MPRPPGAPERPAFRCPVCGLVLTYHNSRVEGTETDQPKVTDVYFCMKHGFFHVSDGKTIAPGM